LLLIENVVFAYLAAARTTFLFYANDLVVFA